MPIGDNLAWRDQADARVTECVRTYGVYIQYVGGGRCASPRLLLRRRRPAALRLHGRAVRAQPPGAGHRRSLDRDVGRRAQPRGAPCHGRAEPDPGSTARFEEWPHSMVPEVLPNPGEILFTANRYYQRPDARVRPGAAAQLRRQGRPLPLGGGLRGARDAAPPRDLVGVSAGADDGPVDPAAPAARAAGRPRSAAGIRTRRRATPPAAGSGQRPGTSRLPSTVTRWTPSSVDAGRAGRDRCVAPAHVVGGDAEPVAAGDREVQPERAGVRPDPVDDGRHEVAQALGTGRRRAPPRRGRRSRRAPGVAGPRRTPAPRSRPRPGRGATRSGRARRRAAAARSAGGQASRPAGRRIPCGHRGAGRDLGVPVVHRPAAGGHATQPRSPATYADDTDSASSSTTTSARSPGRSRPSRCGRAARAGRRRRRQDRLLDGRPGFHRRRTHETSVLTLPASPPPAFRATSPTLVTSTSPSR